MLDKTKKVKASSLVSISSIPSQKTRVNLVSLPCSSHQTRLISTPRAAPAHKPCRATTPGDRPPAPLPTGESGPPGEGASHEDDAVAQAAVVVWGIDHGRRGEGCCTWRRGVCFGLRRGWENSDFGDRECRFLTSFLFFVRWSAWEGLGCGLRAACPTVGWLSWEVEGMGY